jgi:diguanylate cyclase (GGDEF)-like protein
VNRAAAIQLDDGSFALAVAPVLETGNAELVGIVSLARLVPLLEVELPNEHTMLALVDGDGRVLVRAGQLPGGETLEHIDVGSLHSRGALRETEISGLHVIAAAQRVALFDWSVAILTPFETAYAPVFSVVTRVFAIDLCIIVAFSFLAYRITARVLRPIGHLSEAVQRGMLGHAELEIPEVSSRDEIGLLTRTFNDMIRQQRAQREEIEETNRHLKDRNHRLQQMNEVLNQLSITDGLTKLHNHRFFQDHLTREIRRVERTREPLAILLIDIDDFKGLNDRHGHAAGDEILVRIAQIVHGAVRGSDLCARYGGEEFVILAPGTDTPGAYLLAEKVRTGISESSFIVDDSLRPLRVTVSIGVAAFNGNRKRFFQKADQALYRAKADGKNCVVVHEDDVPDDGEARTA